MNKRLTALAVVIMAAGLVSAYMINQARPVKITNTLTRAHYLAGRGLGGNVSVKPNNTYLVDQAMLLKIKTLKRPDTAWLCQSCYGDAVRDAVQIIQNTSYKTSYQIIMPEPAPPKGQLFLENLGGYYRLNLTTLNYTIVNKTLIIWTKK